MLIDRFMPVWDAGEYHELPFDSTPERAYEAIKNLDLANSRLIRLLFAVRGLPRGRRLTFDALTKVGFVSLAEAPPTEIVLGLVGQFWKRKGGVRRVASEHFLSFSEPGYVKATWNFHVRTVNDGSIVSTETRVIATDESSRRAFRRYWLFIGPFSALTRRQALKIIAANAGS